MKVVIYYLCLQPLLLIIANMGDDGGLACWQRLLGVNILLWIMALSAWAGVSLLGVLL